MSSKRLYYLTLAEASEHEARASATEAVAHSMDPDAATDERRKREALYLGLAHAQRKRAEAWRELADRA